MKVPTLALLACLAASVPSTLSAAGMVPPAEQKLYQQVFDAARKDRFDEAERLAMQAKNRLLAKMVRWMAYTKPGSRASFAEITSFIETSPDWPLMSILGRRAEEAIAAATPDEQILSWFARRTPETVDGAMAYARALMRAGQTEEAVQVVRRAWVDGSFGVMQERQFAAAFGEHLRAEDHWKRLDRLLWDRSDAAAQRMLLKVDSDRRLLAQARLALQDRKVNPQRALDAVPKRLRDDPGLVFDRVRWRRQADLDEGAIDLLTHPARNQVRAEAWWQERGILARRALQAGLVSRAYQVAADHGLEPGGVEYAEAEFQAGWIALRFLEDADTGLAHFQRLWDAVTTPLSRSRAAYWAGRSAEAMKNEPLARQWYTRGAHYLTAYYGQLSAARLDNHHWPLPEAPKPGMEDVKRFEGREMVRAIRIMLEMGASENMRAFFIRLNDVVESPGERTLVANLAAQGGRNDLAVVVARRSDREGVFLVEQGWPVPPLAAENTPEKALVLALIRQESGFMQEAQSSVGARGLMQLMPATAKQVARNIKVAYTPAKLDDPDYNVRLGSAYLSELLHRFEGSYILALAAYNAGPSRSWRWIRDYGDPRDPNVDVIDWIESIPFTETRNYVQRVMESVSIYRRRLGNGSEPNLESDLKRWARRS